MKMTDLDKAIALLKDDLTCVLVKDDIVYTSNKKGIAPLIDFIDSGNDIKDFSLADKIIGKAAAYLAIYADIKAVYGEVMSEAAIDLLQEHHIEYSYNTKAKMIINRKGDDICPMEKTVKEIDNPKQAYEALKNKVIELKS